MKEIFITGMEGMAGSHLARAAVEAGFKVSGTHHPSAGIGNIADLLEAQKVNLFGCDLTDRSDVRNLMAGLNPNAIFHLAGKANNPRSWQDATLPENIAMLNYMLQEVTKKEDRPRIIFASTVNVYGQQDSEDPFCEDHQLKPETPYALSKVTQEGLVNMYAQSFGLEVVVARPSQHTGRGRAPEFVEYEIAEQILSIERGKNSSHILVCNAAAEIDLLDVRDVARAYLLLAEKGKSGEVYNVSSGKTRLVREIAQIMIAASHLDSTGEVEVHSTGSERFAPARYSNHKILSLGWESQFTLEQTLEDLLNWMRER